MGEHDFQTELLGRLSSMESKIDIMYEELRSLQADAKKSSVDTTDALTSAKSAHKRIDGIKTDAMLLGAVISFFVTLIFRLLGK